MKITFDSRTMQEINATASNTSSAKSRIETVNKTQEPVSVGTSLSQNKSYEGVAMSKSDVQNAVGAIDVESTQDYLTVMAHSMSEEDYAQMVKSGERPMSVDAEDSVTILDKIKLAVAQGGTEIEGFTDDISPEALEAMTGRRTMSTDVTVESYDVTISPEMMEKIVKAYEELSEVTSMSEGMKKYFVGTGEELTIDNLYLSKHRVVSDTFEQGSEYFEAGATGYLAKKADQTENGNLSAEVEKLLEAIGYPVDEESVSNGLWLIDNSLCISRESLDRLKIVDSITLPVSDMDFARIELTAIAYGREPKDAPVTEKETVYSQAVKVARVAAEARLKMTCEANLMLLKSDFSIDVSDMEDYLLKLKEIENKPEYEELKSVAQTDETVDRIREYPAAIIGKVSSRITEITLSELDTIGKSTTDFAMVEARYESVGTQVRRDLGDSIKKAFRNVDELLTEMDMDVTDENRRAVRILGYNRMAVTKEKVTEVKEADSKLQSVLNRLTPSDTVKLIRKGTSPLDMTIKELNEYLDRKQDVQKEEITKYSKYLYKLEQNHEISHEERKEYIEVYRFFHNLEKTDLAAVGSVLNAGLELTVGNLKTAMKTAKTGGMDVKVDASFGFLVEDIKEEMLIKPVTSATFTDDTTLDALYGQLSRAEADKQAEQEWIHNEYTEMRMALNSPEEAVETLINTGVPVTAENLEAAFSLMKNRGKAFEKARDDRSVKLREALADGFSSRDEAVQDYAEMTDAMQESIYEEAFNQDSYLDVKAMRLSHVQLSVAKAMTESEAYEVPVEIGDMLTTVSVRILHNTEEEANVRISLESEDLGRVNATLYTDEDNITGFIACNLTETVTKMQKVADILGDGVKAVHSEKLIAGERLSKLSMANNRKEVDSSMLYKAAKQFLAALKGL